MPIPVESFYLAPDVPGTLQQRIQAMVAEGVVAGRFRAGDRLPSSRGLARHLGVSRITVTLAYTELVANDYLSARGRSGYFVSETAPRHPEFGLPTRRAQERTDWDTALVRRFSGQPRMDKPEDWRKYPYPFIYGQADAALFDHGNWRQCALRALGMRDFEALTLDYFERDDPLLIDYLLRTILTRRGIAAHRDEVLLTLGAQNGLWIAAHLLLDVSRRAVIENPCYPGLRAILQGTGCTVETVDVDGGGLPPEAVPLPADVVFTTASHQSPTNATMPVERRRALLQRASEGDFLVVEDDYEFEMSFLHSAAPSLKSLDAEGRVIHVGSFSKSLFPGLRLGYLVGPAAFIAEARALRATVLRHPPGHTQRTLAYFLSLGHYDALLNRLKTAYKKRRQLMDEAIHEHGLTIAGRSEFGGSSFWMQAPEHVDTAMLAQRLRGEGVLIEPGKVFFSSTESPSNFYRLAYSSIPNNRIGEGLRLIARMLRAMPESAR